MIRSDEVQRLVSNYSAYTFLWGTNREFELPPRDNISFLIPNRDHRRQLFRTEDRIRAMFPKHDYHTRGIRR